MLEESDAGNRSYRKKQPVFLSLWLLYWNGSTGMDQIKKTTYNDFEVNK